MTVQVSPSTPSARPRKRWFRRGQSGQALVILALGFIALTGFVGIVTDVSLLFVRYSTLRRAVDAAAVAAAGQMRRGFDPTPGDAVAEGEAESVASVNLAARQFIELYGLDPTNVLVETCRAQQVGRFSTTDQRPVDSSGVLFYNYIGTGSPTDPWQIDPDAANRINVLANAQDRRHYEELCTRDELKLVRVTAQIASPTVFFSLLGYPTITLTESAISQTAVIDSVLIFDVSVSLLDDTDYTEWEAIGLGRRYIPFGMDYYAVADWDELLNHNQTYANTRFPAINYTEPGAGAQAEPREFCRTRAFPYTAVTNINAPIARLTRPTDPSLGNSYNAYMTSVGRNLSEQLPDGQFLGFVPQYDYFGCCNDPNGDMAFDDLICQPFRGVRDAAEGFLNRLDFVRGDRVALVTFDRGAHLIDPDGGGSQSPMIETERTSGVVGSDGYRRGAIDTLNTVVGVSAEPSFYRDTNNDGNWDALVNGGAPATYNDLMNTEIIGNIKDTPTKDSCPFMMAYLEQNYSLVDLRPDGSPRTAITDTLLIDLTRPGLQTTNPVYLGMYAAFGVTSYEYLASCAGGNIGGGLAQGNLALVNNGRTEGAVWIMVLLSDGAASASDPLARQNSSPVQIRTPDPARGGSSITTANRANPYAPRAPGDPAASVYRAEQGEYGGFGACPVYPSNPYASGRGFAESRVYPAGGKNLLDFPYCGDIQPQTRHFCGDVAGNPNTRPIDTTPNCNIEYTAANATTYQPYDTDDYAHDWADWVGLGNLANLPPADQVGRVGEQQLPIIFTIGFNMRYQNCAGCSDADRRANNTADYLGEELLRYIGDVGDNNRIDDDYWQFVMSDRIENQVADDAGTIIANPAWGARGPCQMASSSPQQAFSPLPPKQQCGNYWNAESTTALVDVFNEISSRMFTRLSQ